MERSALVYVASLAAGAVVGVLGAVLGTGGGVFLIPILVIALGVPIHQAIATSILCVIATSSAVASTNVERGTANMRLGMTLEIATTLGAIAGGLTAAWIPAAMLELTFAVVLLPVAWLMWRGHTRGHAGGAGAAGEVLLPTGEPDGIAGRYVDLPGGEIIEYQPQRLWAGMLISLVAGNLSGMLGVGGGVFKVPALHLACKVPIKAAAATSNFMIGVTGAASAFLYFGRGEIRPALTAMVVLGTLIGSALGTALNRRISGSGVRKLFAALLFAVAVEMMYRSLGGNQ